MLIDLTALYQMLKKKSQYRPSNPYMQTGQYYCWYHQKKNQNCQTDHTQ